jgi:ABC-type transport system involved in multi-copper enzyme maturation permease subunit
MIVLPVIARELRVAARRPGTYRTRWGAGLAATILLAWANLAFSSQGQGRATLGQTLFQTISGLAFAYCLLIGARVTSDCVSEEKRDGTLGLLFLTDLKGWQVILGKLVASSVNSAYGLLAILPLLAIPLLLGGVTLLQVGQMALVLINTLFFSLSMGMLISTLSRNDRKAMFATLLVLFAIAAGPLLGAAFWVVVAERVQAIGDLFWVAAMLLPTPVFGFGYVIWPGLTSLRIPWAPPVWSFWSSLAIAHLAGWLALMIASRLLPVIWKDRPRKTNTQRMAEWCRRLGQGNPTQQLAWRSRLLALNPFLWLVARDRLKTSYAWVFLVGASVTWMWGRYRYGDVMFDTYPAVPTILLIHGFLKLWILSESSARLVEDHRSGALEMLLCTPLSVPAILDGQLLALRRQFAWPLLVLSLLEITAFNGWFSWKIISCVITMMFADALTLAWVGMYLSLSGKSINRVLWTSSLLVLLLPWVLYLLSVGLHGLFTPLDRYERLQFAHKVGVWFGIGLLTDFLLAICWARPRLRKQFRALALQPSERQGRAGNRWKEAFQWSSAEER